MFPGGWHTIVGGHAIILMIERMSESNYSFIICNSGNGVQYHPSNASSTPKIKYQTTVRFNNIPSERMLDDGFWYFIWRMKIISSDDHNVDMFYDVLLP